MRASEELTRLLVNLAAAGGSVPCGEYGNHEQWTSDHLEDRQQAVGRCQSCPVLSVCAAAADESGEQWHVWGGVDRTRAPKRGRRAA